MGQSTTSAPSMGPSSDRARKSTSRNRGSFPSAWKPPPPTVDGRLFTSPVKIRSPSSGERRNERGSSSGSGPRKCRCRNLISSLLISPVGANGGSRRSRWLRPFSSTITDQPAAVSTSAAVAPPGPLPTTTASQSRSVTTADLLVRVAAWLHVTREPDRLPAGEAAVAAVLGRAVRALTRVPVQQLLELGSGVEPLVLLLCGECGEAGAERGDAVAVLLLPALHRAVELALGQSLRAFDARAPSQLVEPREAEELPERRVAAVPTRERSTGPDARWIDCERAQQAVDVIGDAEGGRAGVPARRRDEPRASRLDNRVRLWIEKDRHAGESYDTVSS